MIFFLFIILTIAILYTGSIKFYIAYVFFAFFILRFIMFKFGDYFAPMVNNVILLSMIIKYMQEKKCRKHDKFVFRYLSLFLIYFFLFPLIRFDCSFLNLANNIIYFKNFVILFLWGLILIENKKKYEYIEKYIVKVIAISGLFESFLVYMQLISSGVSNFFKVDSYSYKGQIMNILDTSFDVNTGNIASGTLLDPGSVSLYLSVTIIFLILYNIKRKISIEKIILYFVLFSALFLTGVRAPLIATIIISGVVVFIYYKKVFYISMAVIITFLVFNGISKISNIGKDSYANADRSNSIERSTSSLIIFSDFQTLSDKTTLGLTIQTLPYVLNSPVFGNGNHVIGKGYYLKNIGVNLEEYSTTDAQLIFIIAEVGVIGLLVLFLPFIYFKNQIKDKRIRIYLNILFASCLLNSIVDPGITYDIYILLLFSAGVLIDKNNKLKQYL